jgi:hypothetical protein
MTTLPRTLTWRVSRGCLGLTQWWWNWLRMRLCWEVWLTVKGCSYLERRCRSYLLEAGLSDFGGMRSYWNLLAHQQVHFGYRLPSTYVFYFLIFKTLFSLFEYFKPEYLLPMESQHVTSFVYHPLSRLFPSKTLSHPTYSMAPANSGLVT